MYAPLVRKMMTNTPPRVIMSLSKKLPGERQAYALPPRKHSGKVGYSMNSTMKKLNPIWFSAFALYLIRRSERIRGFDPDTGLTIPVFSRYTLIAGVILTALALIYHCRALPKARPHFTEHFTAPTGRATFAWVISCFFLIGGGALLGYQAVLAHEGAAALAAAVLAVITGGSFLVLAQQLRRGTAGNVLPLLPSLFFAALWLLRLYLPAGSDPVLARYWLPILAAAVDAYAFAQLAGFCRRETGVRSFGIVARFAIILSCATTAMADAPSVLIFLGCAGILGVFLALETDSDEINP